MPKVNISAVLLGIILKITSKCSVCDGLINSFDYLTLNRGNYDRALNACREIGVWLPTDC
jgi:hypothetical protein